MKNLSAIILLLPFLLVRCSGPKNVAGDVPTMTPEETYQKLGHDTSYVFLDVRTAAEYESPTGHLAGAILIPVDTLEHEIAALEPYRSKTIIAYCRTGHRSARAQRILSGHGFRAVSMAGGITRWNAENLTVIKEQQR